MVCRIRGKHSHFCIGRAQSIKCHDAAYSSCGLSSCASRADTHQVNLPIKPAVDYPVGSVTRKWFSCQQNQPFQEVVSYYLSWLSVIVSTLVQSKTRFSDPPVFCKTPCWPPNCHWLVTVLPQGNVGLHFELFFMAFLWWVAGGSVVNWWK